MTYIPSSRCPASGALATPAKSLHFSPDCPLDSLVMVMESVPLYFSRFHQLLGSLSCSLTIEISSEVLSPWRSSLIRREASVEALQQPKSLRQLHSLSLAFASLLGHPET